MAEVAAVAKEVRQHWLSQGLRVSSVEPEELAELRRLRPEGIPEEYEAFLRIAGLPDDEDGAGFRFWLPKEVRATSDVLSEAGHGSDATEPSVIIADYLQESWWYGLWLAGPFTGRVSLVLGHEDGRDPQPPLGTFVDFLLAYLNDDVRLYPPASSPEHAGPEPRSRGGGG
jgi:hypothetical protein